MKKILALLLGLAIVMSSFAGCSKGSNPAKTSGESAQASGEPAQASGEPAKIQLWTFQDLHNTFYKSMAEKWNKENPKEQIALTATTLPYDDMTSPGENGFTI